ncbi:WD40-repeat-containing domain protein [Protomyces lactucae-debilis]|uniref:WD40-repeat-containing domain protein n=1 Tax=Protomyces lactucae-debilis TaxID=2754530 RepID=A0A1Y2FQS4_PROLT|nr:WD40-repeat-containing domain protein [Protomyces lactucae-debilis]ORY86352.1 WD40-repeat-containing domain protein [Protomyces lactucae-debilis]
MKASAIQIHWHEEAPIYSCHFEPHGRGRLATAGGDGLIYVWELTPTESIPKVTHLSTLKRHAGGAVNAVRFDPKGEHIASAGDDGCVIIWVPSDAKDPKDLDNSTSEDKEFWRVLRTCRSASGTEIYDLAWSPDGRYLITGAMDNVARIYDARDGQCVRQIAEHSHYVQGVAWDPLNEYVATQSSDRSLNVYNLKTKDGVHVTNAQTSSKMVLPGFSKRVPAALGSPAVEALASPSPSAPGTPTLSMMRPPAITPSRRSSFNESNRGRSPSPAPVVPLPAVMGSPAKPKSSVLFHDEALLSFFRRLTFSPDGSLLLVPAGIHKGEETVDTVYIYTRAGFHKPPVAHLPNQKKPAIAIRCCPKVFKLRAPQPTVHATMDSSSSEEMHQLPPAETSASSAEGGPVSDAFHLPYAIVYAVATQESVLIYNTQQLHPLAVLSNLHYATFTDLTWTPDGHTLLMSSTDGYCSACVFEPGELGQVYENPPFVKPTKQEFTMPERADHAAIPSPLGALQTPPATPASGTIPAQSSLTSSTGQPAPGTVAPAPLAAKYTSSPRPPTSTAIGDEPPAKKRRIAPTVVSSAEPSRDTSS